MLLNNLLKLKGSKNKKTRIGRGYGSGHGGHSSTRGTKGQNARTGGGVPLYFEGGQLPLVKRLPHLKGFTNANSKKVGIIKTSLLNKLELKKVNPEILIEKGIIRILPKDGLKILKDEDLKLAITLSGFNYSKTALKSIEKAGGKVL
ncbi:50S ribosomal protein L15 [candidate division WWE3 bacterium CG10_big_fil_rev_8_21_14_0_10_32_10]|uniref:Large ribosomal subunit protein uL15 n=1 Tax=candidate division WWE3 bacterium CG10_big_fil_rev_8_21_14_0_10_32_10 TaxID=1975090 RepID=A0A2H0RBF0_UNCKA|nr:MAG: 50S ribosomal protein L15 [candidate division WWE3 bacterium CG10_big_fil_rev_8_21_14_0_10_32_10]